MIQGNLTAGIDYIVMSLTVADPGFEEKGGAAAALIPLDPPLSHDAQKTVGIKQEIADTVTVYVCDYETM